MAKRAMILLLMLLGPCRPVLAEREDPSLIQVEIDVPSSGWDLKLKSLHLKDGQLWVVGELVLLNDKSLPRISKVTDQLPVAEEWSKLPRRLLITGKTWKESFFNGPDWKREDAYAAVTRAQLQKALEGSREIYSRPRGSDAPGFVGLTRAQATELAGRRGFTCFFANDPWASSVTTDIDPKRVTLFMSGGKVVRATRR